MRLTYFTHILIFVLGAIDDSHIKINKPIKNQESYDNRKQFFSLHIQGVVYDARVFNSPIRNNLHQLCGS